MPQPRADHEFAVRFRPPSDANVVAADVFLEVLAKVVAGLESLKNRLAPRVAAHYDIGLAEAREALQLSVASSRPGSLLVPFEIGPERGLQPLLVHREIPATFWRMGTESLKSAAKGMDRESVSAACAEAFATAGAIAKKARTVVDLVDRRRVDHQRSDWRSGVNVTRIEKPLREYAARRKAAGPHTTVQQIGRITDLIAEPLAFRLRVGDERMTVQLPAALREQARALWGQEVVVSMKARVDADGNISDPAALALGEAARATNLVDEYLASRGSARDLWSTDEAREYLDSLRRGPTGRS